MHVYDFSHFLEPPKNKKKKKNIVCQVCPKKKKKKKKYSVSGVPQKKKFFIFWTSLSSQTLHIYMKKISPDQCDNFITNSKLA